MGLMEQEILKQLEAKVDRMIVQLGERSPHFAGEDGTYDDMPTDFWTSGFWPGILWILYDVTGKPHYKEAAWRWDEELEQWFVRPTDELNHDVGFQFLPTAVLKSMITGDEDGKRRGLAAANFLAGRFNPVGQFIRAWNGDRHGWSIIDAMMNISLLYWASEVTGDRRFAHIATAHATTTMKYGIREDGSTNHIITFHPETGEFVQAMGGQGLAADSTWSRGNAWALYGFANTYRFTGNPVFLHTAKRIAHYFIANLPEDRIPYWDFRLPSLEGMSRDSSAAAIAASGLLEIADSVPAGEKRLYRGAAERLLEALTTRCATWDQPEHEAILRHATGSGTALIDVSLIYGDYYYVEAIAKLNGWRHRIY